MQINEIVHELDRKYNHTFIFVEIDGKEVLAYVDSIQIVGEGNSASGEISLSTKEYGKLRYKIPTAEQLIFRLPKSRVYQQGAHAYIVNRVPARQWQRGMSPNNSSIQSISHIVAGGRGAVPYSLDMVQNAFTGETFSPDEAIKMLASGKYASVAIHGNWALTLSPTEERDGYVLLYKLLPVARISATGRPLRILHGQFEVPVRQLYGDI